MLAVQFATTATKDSLIISELMHRPKYTVQVVNSARLLGLLAPFLTLNNVPTQKRQPPAASRQPPSCFGPKKPSALRLTWMAPTPPKGVPG